MGKNIKGRELGRGISQRKDGWYIARYTNWRGKRVQKVFRELSECRKWLADSKHLDMHNNINLPEYLTVNGWFEYWSDIKRRTVRYNTMRNYYDRYHNNIAPVIGDKILRTVNTIHCQMIMNLMADEGYASSTIAQTRNTLYSMLEYAYQTDVIIKNPCSKIVKSNIGKRTEKKEALTVADQKIFCSTIAGNEYEYQYRFLLQTGLRVGELIGLKWSDIDWEKRTITINRTMEYRYPIKEWVIGRPKSKSGYRTIPLTEEAIKILKLQEKKNQSISTLPVEWSEFVFLCRKGTPVKNSTYDTMLFHLCVKADLPQFSMHVLRHTFATRCIEAGMKPKTLQTILGHSNIGVTMNLYVHTTDDEKHKEINKIEKALKVV